MTPLNDLLITKVELANARQDLVAAQSNLEIARANFNLLLRRPIGTSVTPVDVLDFEPLSRSLVECLETAEKGRVEVAVADLDIQIREKEVTLSKKDYYPTVQVQGNYYKLGTDWQVDGGEGISDSSFWDVQAQARWDFWQWGKTGYGVAEKKSKLARPVSVAPNCWITSSDRSSRLGSRLMSLRRISSRYNPPSIRPGKGFVSVKSCLKSRWPHPRMSSMRGPSFPKP